MQTYLLLSKTSSIYPALPGQYVVVVVVPISQWWWSVSPRVFLDKIPFLALSHYHGNHFAKILAHVLSWSKPIIMPSFREIHLPVWPE